MSYALRQPGGPVELAPGVPIVSYGVQFSYETMLLWSDAERAARGVVAVVEAGPVPAGKVSTGSTLSDDGATVRRVLTLVDQDLVSRKLAVAGAVDARRDTILTSGFAHDFGAPNGVKVLQTREGDETNWLTLQNSCIAAVMAGQGATVGAVIRTTDNINISLSYADGLQVMLAMAAWGAAVYAASWKLKDTITAAADQAGLVAIDTSAGWPANP